MLLLEGSFMWCLEVIHVRNQAFAAGLDANEVNFLFNNTITPFHRDICKQSELKIEQFKKETKNSEESN